MVSVMCNSYSSGSSKESIRWRMRMVGTMSTHSVTFPLCTSPLSFDGMGMVRCRSTRGPGCPWTPNTIHGAVCKITRKHLQSSSVTSLSIRIRQEKLEPITAASSAWCLKVAVFWSRGRRWWGSPISWHWRSVLSVFCWSLALCCPLCCKSEYFAGFIFSSWWLIRLSGLPRRLCHNM